MSEPIVVVEAPTAPDVVNFMNAAHDNNRRVTLVVSHAWMTTSIDIKSLGDICTRKFGLSEKKMKNAAFSMRIPNAGISPSTTLYAPKADTRFRVHITGIKNLEQISSTMTLLGEAIESKGHTFSFGRPEIDLVNLKFKVENVRIRSVPLFIKTSCQDWICSTEELKAGKPINISNENCTILLWASGSTIVMIKRLRPDENFDNRLSRASDLLSRIRQHCATN
jgi:hypothetical protein